MQAKSFTQRFIRTIVTKSFIALLFFTAAFGVTNSSTILAQSDDVKAWQAEMSKINKWVPEPFVIDEERVRAAGIRRLFGKHLVIYTDVPSDDLIDELPGVFDLAVNQWCDVFAVAENRSARWKMRGYLMVDENSLEKFARAGLKPDSVPYFQAGFQRHHDLWLYLQPGDYYTRHLLIHEGTHAFMEWFLNGYGPAWYSEGMAELLGVHRWRDGKLKIGYQLNDRREAEYWGRVKRVREERGTVNAMSLSDVLNIPPNSFKDVRYYAWSWAGCQFLSNHPRSKADFKKLFHQTKLGPQGFNERLLRNLRDDWQILQRDWLLYVHEIDYGFDIERGRIHEAKKAKSGFQIRADVGWQTAVSVSKGDRIRVVGKGRFVVGKSIGSDGNEHAWPCESNGITIQYNQGRPLGILLAGILDVDAANIESQVAGLKEPMLVGSQHEFVADRDGMLCFRINESPAKMNDNQGTLEVLVEKLK
jgi:hypothetical protein